MSSAYQKVKAWRAKNPDKRKAQQQRYRSKMDEKQKSKLRSAGKRWLKNNREYVLNSLRNYGQENKISIRFRKIKQKYGLTKAQYDTMNLQQGGLCAICNLSFSYPLRVDHCHNTGRVRGLVCQRCNTMIGMALDNTQTLLAAIRYLEKQQ